MRKNPILILLITVMLIAQMLPAQNSADELSPVTQTFALTNAKIVQKPGQVIEKGHIIIKDGLIHAVGANVSIPVDAKVIAADSLTIYAGFIDGLSYTGIPRPENNRNNRPTVKHPGEPGNKLAGIQPELHAKDAIKANDKSIADLRKNGFTVAQVAPRGRMLPGSTDLVLLAGESADAMLLKAGSGLYSQLAGANRVYPRTVIGVMSKYRELYKQAEQAQSHEKAYAKNPQGMKRPGYDPALRAFYPVINQEKAVVFKASDVKSAYRIFNLQEDLGFPLVLADVKQGWHIIDEIKQKNIPVYLSLELPNVKEKKKEEEEEEVSEEVKKFQDRQQAELKKHQEQAATFEQAGIEFGFSLLSTKSKDIRPNLRTLIKNGLSENTALAALTTVPAKQLGMSNILGTVEKGKIANLVVTDESYFAEKSNVRYVFVDGQPFEYEVKPKKKKGDASKKVDVAGTWNYVVKAPDQEREGKLTLKNDDGELTGTISNPNTGQDGPVQDLELNGNELSFTTGFSMGTQQLTLQFNLIIDGDDLEGNVSVGEFGTFEVEGQRSSTPD